MMLPVQQLSEPPGREPHDGPPQRPHDSAQQAWCIGIPVLHAGSAANTSGGTDSSKMASLMRSPPACAIARPPWPQKPASGVLLVTSNESGAAAALRPRTSPRGHTAAGFEVVTLIFFSHSASSESEAEILDTTVSDEAQKLRLRP
jgi:hypothetical protein